VGVFQKEDNMAGKAEPKAPETGANMVKVRLFKDNDKYKDDVFVAVNGESYLIRRGEEVEVPDYIAEVLDHSAKADAETAERIARVQNG
jgi:hypothetical protein